MRVPRTAHVLPATPLAYNPCPCTLRHPRGLVSPGSCTGPSSMLSHRPPLPWQVRVGDPQAASAALSDAVRPDAALPDAAACCDAPPPFPGHSPCPRAAAARARHRLLFLESALSFLSQYMSKLSPVCRLKCVYSSFRSFVCYTLSALQYPVLLGLLCVTLSALHPCFRQKEGVTPCLEGVVHYTSKRV